MLTSTKLFVYNSAAPGERRSADVERGALSAADGCRAGDPARLVAARAEHRARGPGGALPGPGDRLHHRLEAAPDHDREGSGLPGGCRACPRLPGCADGGARAAAPRGGPPGTRCRLLGPEAGDAGAAVAPGFTGGVGRDPAIAR